jgi:hypothetical protein
MQVGNYNISSHNSLTIINENTVKYYWKFKKNVNSILITSKKTYMLTLPA